MSENINAIYKLGIAMVLLIIPNVLVLFLY